MNANTFHIKASALLERYKRAKINAQKKHLAALARLSRITGEPQPIPQRLRHLRNGVSQ